MEADHDYLLFLRWVGGAEEELARLVHSPLPRDDGTKAEALAIIRCNGLTPGYVVLEDYPVLAWKIDDGGVHVRGASRESIPDSIDILAIDKRSFALKTADVERYLDGLREAAKNAK